MLPSRRLRLVLLVTALACAPAPAEDLAFAERSAVSDEALSRMRGGFTATVGGATFELSFGIERVISVNGETIATTNFRVPALHELNGLRSVPLQSGAGNSVAAQLAAGGPLHVVQNSLDNQVLRQMTTINASVRNLELYRSAQFGALLNRQLLMSLR
jgi:hypothetical protein